MWILLALALAQVEVTLNGDTKEVAPNVDILTVSGKGTLIPQTGKTQITAATVKVTKEGSEVLAQGLVITNELSLEPKVTLGPTTNGKITLDNEVSLIFASRMEGENGTFGTLDLGAIGNAYNVLPKKVDINFLPTTDLAEDFEQPIVRGKNLTNCDQWIEKVNFIHQMQVELTAKCVVEGEVTSLCIARPAPEVPEDSTWLVLGVVLAVLVFVVIVVVLIAVCKRRRKKNNETSESSSSHKTVERDNSDF